MAMPASNSIMKFADDTTGVGLITNNDETAYREERALGVWCQENNLSLNVNKTKEIIVDFGNSRGSTPLSTSKGQQWRKWEVLGSSVYTSTTN